MSERLILKGALAEKRSRRLNLAAKAEGLIGAVKDRLSMAKIQPLKDLKMPEIMALTQDLAGTHAEFLQVNVEIEDLERELS